MKFGNVKALIYLFSVILVGFSTGCEKERGDFVYIQETCAFEGKDILKVKEAFGTLVYKGEILGSKQYENGVFIINSNIDQIALPLQVCNFPSSKFPDLKEGDEVEVVFGARIELLPETVDADRLNMEINKIRITDNSK